MHMRTGHKQVKYRKSKKINNYLIEVVCHLNKTSNQVICVVSILNLIGLLYKYQQEFSNKEKAKKDYDKIIKEYEKNVI